MKLCGASVRREFINCHCHSSTYMWNDRKLRQKKSRIVDCLIVKLFHFRIFWIFFPLRLTASELRASQCRVSERYEKKLFNLCSHVVVYETVREMINYSKVLRYFLLRFKCFWRRSRMFYFFDSLSIDIWERKENGRKFENGNYQESFLWAFILWTLIWFNIS